VATGSKCSYTDQIVLRSEEFQGDFPALAAEALEKVMQYAVHTRLDFGAEGRLAYITFTLEADDGWDLHEQATDLACEVNGYTLMTPEKKRATFA
jgi:hypothetical protein